MSDAKEKVKAMLADMTLKAHGTLEETDETYSFEDSWRRFESMLDGMINPSPETMAKIKALKEPKQKRAK